MNTSAVFNLPEHTLYNVERRYDQNRQKVGLSYLSMSPNRTTTVTVAVIN